MRIIFFICALLVLLPGIQAQTLHGVVVDGESAKNLGGIMVVNLSTDRSTITGAQGDFELAAKKGDMLTFSSFGYHTIQRLANPAIYMRVEMRPLSVKLPEYVISDYTAFQKDSMEMTQLYEKELTKKAIKPGFSTANGGGFTGLIGGPVQRMSKSYKQNKRFKETFRKDMEQRFIDTRYTAALVSSLTGFKGDTLAVFMNTYKMEHDFARTATELELKMWIRDNYKAFNPKHITIPHTDSLKHR